MIQTLAALVLVFGILGCGRVKEEAIPVKNNDPMLQVKATLQNYVKGQPLASEVTSYDYMINAVRKVSPEKADILKAGLDDIKKTPQAPAAKAKALMQKLGIDGADKK